MQNFYLFPDSSSQYGAAAPTPNLPLVKDYKTKSAVFPAEN